jgi:F-type H+-transporting ATPase subunit b
VEDLFNPITILLHVINAIILLVALYFLLYKPVRKYTAARAQGIDDQLKNAQDTQNKAQDQFSASQQKLKDADREAMTAISQGSQKAQEQAQDIVKSAREQANQIVAQARQEANTMLFSAHEAMADEAAVLAVEIAAKVLSREVKAEDHQQLIDEFVKKVG